MICIDIIILSYAKTPTLRNVTEQAIISLFESENVEEIKFEVLVIESISDCAPYQFQNVCTIYPNQTFNFNKFLNIGIKNSSNSFICFCNNDLVFEKKWAKNLINAFQRDKELISASPICSIFHPTISIFPETGNQIGYEIRNQIAGWCFMVKREIFDTIGLFDERFKFWYADADYAMLLKKYNLKHVLVTSSMVKHLDGTSTKELDQKNKLAMTSDQFWYFQYKWQHHNYLLYCYRNFRRGWRALLRTNRDGN